MGANAYRLFLDFTALALTAFVTDRQTDNVHVTTGEPSQGGLLPKTIFAHDMRYRKQLQLLSRSGELPG